MAVGVFINQPFFPDHNEDIIDTLQFLNASRGLVWLIDQFGFGFELVKEDLLGNIKKLQRKYHENTIEHKCLKQMILTEYSRGENYAVESLLWLRRGLSLMGTFLSNFLEHERKGLNDENLSRILCNAYEKTLQTHHGFGTRLLFRILCKKCPSRSSFLKILGSGQMNDVNSLISMLDDYCQTLLLNLEVLLQFYKKHNINPYH